MCMVDKIYGIKFCIFPRELFMYFVSQNKENYSLHIIKCVDFVTEKKCVYCEKRTEYSNLKNQAIITFNWAKN
jgi:hypothetical protein